MTADRLGIYFSPWVGDRYACGKRLLVLGEAHYTKHNDERPDLTQIVTRRYVDEGRPHRFWTGIARAIAGKPISLRDCRTLWHTLAFYNFVQQSVGNAPRIPPAPEMWLAAQEPFLRVLAQLEPRTILVLGRRLWSNLPHAPSCDLERTEHSWPAKAYVLPSNAESIASYINHPSSRGFSWKKWSGVVRALAAKTDCKP